MTEEHHGSKRIQQAIEAIRDGNKHRARYLIQAELRENPESLDAWTWACDLTDSTQEKILCLRKVLSIDPDHEPARRYLDRLQASSQHEQIPRQNLSYSQSDRSRTSSRWNLIDILLTPFVWLFNISLPAALVLLLFSLSFAGYAYYRVNTSLFGLTRLKFSQLSISPTRETIEARDYQWRIKYENKGHSTYTGTVRHVAPIRIDELRILTHDVLVTSGDFANPEQVKTDVINHRFFWRAPYTKNPEGSIHLLHIIPSDPEISEKLYDIRSWQQVEISGWEILDVQAYNRHGEYLMSWKDTGCNTILVDEVRILSN